MNLEIAFHFGDRFGTYGPPYESCYESIRLQPHPLLTQRIDLLLRFLLSITNCIPFSDVNKDWTHKDQDKDNDLTYKDSKQKRRQAQHSSF